MPRNNNQSISKQVIILAIPIIFSNLSRVVMGLADMAMVSRLGATALAATGMGSLLLWICLSMGIGVQQLCKQFVHADWGKKDILNAAMPCIMALFWLYPLQFRLLLSEFYMQKKLPVSFLRIQPLFYTVQIIFL